MVSHSWQRKLAVTCAVVLVFDLFVPAAAFGPGKLAKSSALNNHAWLHGDISLLLLALPKSFLEGENYAFTELERLQIYFGNWLRDYSQIIDVKLLSLGIPESLLRAVVSVLAFFEFGLATDEFEVTSERLGLYRPEEHIDNPRGYGLDERGFYHGDGHLNSLDPRLRHLVRPEETDVDPQTGMKNYIARDDLGIQTSASFVRSRLRECILNGRLARTGGLGSKEARTNALRNLGAALHTLEDFAAHSNYTELALMRLGEGDIFPFVGDACRTTLGESSITPGASVPPLVTGTFGTLDLIVSLIGMLDDKAAGTEKSSPLNDLLRKTQEPTQRGFDAILSEVEQGLLTLSPLDGIQSIKDQLPFLKNNVTTVEKDGGAFRNFSADDPAAVAEVMRVLSQSQTALWKYLEPVLKIHDKFMKWFMEVAELLRIEALVEAARLVKKAIRECVDKVLAIVVNPLLHEVRRRLEVVKMDLEEVDRTSSTFLDIYHPDSNVSDPSHSILAKDHFSNVLNPPAGQLATAITNHTTQLIVKAWDDPTIPLDLPINQILSTFHHPSIPIPPPISISRSTVTGLASASTPLQPPNPDPQPHPTTPTFIQNVMFTTIQHWWTTQSEATRERLRRQLSKSGIQTNRNNPSEFRATCEGPAVFEESAPEVKDPRTVWTGLQRSVNEGVEGIARKPTTKIKSAAKSFGEAVRRGS